VERDGGPVAPAHYDAESSGPVQEGSTLERFERALRGSNVTVFTHDRDLRYGSISGPIFGRRPDEIIGRTDDEILPPEDAAQLLAAKREALASGATKDCEITVNHGGTVRSFDLHIEPLMEDGQVGGLTCAAVDVTERKESEAHLRLLMRELTHRSKNLLAVIQAMARQTARNVDSVDRFVDRFGARLQALANSHDLLVQEGWHGASLSELVRLEIGPYAARSAAQVLADGPNVVLKPEAAQSLGLALHELAENAARYGALSSSGGRLAVTWRRLAPADGYGAELLWVESDGPSVRAPERRGFGTMVIERNLARSLDAEVELAFFPEGVRCRVLIPMIQLAISP
jgi:PAS domain S-box-containing protein